MRLFLAMPIYGDVPWQTVASINQLQRAGIDCPVTIKLMAGESNIVEARNVLTAQFLNSDCDRMLFVDSDMVFRPEQIQRLVSHDEGMVGALYCKGAHGEPDYCCAGLPGQERGVADERGLIEVSRIGTGLLCLRRYVFERMEDSLNPEIYQSRHGEQRDFWHTEHELRTDGRRYYIGEDYAFCLRWRGLGGKIYADAQVLAGHVKPVVFPPDWEVKAGFSEVGRRSPSAPLQSALGDLPSAISHRSTLNPQPSTS